MVLIFTCYSAPAPTCARFQEHKKFKISHCVTTTQETIKFGACKKRKILQEQGRGQGEGKGGGWRPGHPGPGEPQLSELLGEEQMQLGAERDGMIKEDLGKTTIEQENSRYPLCYHPPIAAATQETVKFGAHKRERLQEGVQMQFGGKGKVRLATWAPWTRGTAVMHSCEQKGYRFSYSYKLPYIH